MKNIEMVGRVQKNFNLTLPKAIRERLHLEMGDFVMFLVSKDGVFLKPKKLIDSSQAYFWTREWQKEERKAEEDIKAGRVSKTKNVKELIRQLKK